MIGFDNSTYIKNQTENILKRIAQFDNKLYLEFGGKLFDDYHAARVLPGFDLNGKIKILKSLKDNAEVVFCISAIDIENNKIRDDLGITYDQDVLRLIDNIRTMDILVSSIVITQFAGQPLASAFKNRLELRGERVYIHKPIYGYPSDVDFVVSDKGYGSNPYIETTRPLVVVTAPGPSSGKLATCLSQLYHEHIRNVKAGYAKFETFPIWNLPLKHPVNLAYEAATTELKDVNMIDPFHLEAYGITAVNYNRDIEVFPIVKTMLAKINGNLDVYNSPTDMGINMAGSAIIDDDAVREASKQEIIRRYYKTWCAYKQGRVDVDAGRKIELIMQQLDLKPVDRDVVSPAMEKSKMNGEVPAMSIKLPDGTIVTGKESHLLKAPSSCVLNAVKHVGKIADEIHLISPIVLEPMLKLKQNILKSKIPSLSLDEVLLALSICAATNPTAQLAMDKLECLRGCEAHCTNMVSQPDEDILRRLGIHLTCEAEYPSKDLYFI